MRPIFIRIGPVSVFSYGLMLVLAVISVLILVRMEVKRKGFEAGLSYELLFYFVVSGIVGGRLLYVVLNWAEFSHDISKVFAMGKGGFAFFGGLLVGILVLLVFAKARKLPIGSLLDILAPGLALGEAIARIGCFLNGCCYGYPTSSFLGIEFPRVFGGPRHPTQLYQFFVCLSIFVVLMCLRKKIKTPGNLFWLYVLLYSVGRFVVEFFRDETQKIGGLTYSQVIVVTSFLAASLVLVSSFRKMIKKKQESRVKS